MGSVGQKALLPFPLCLKTRQQHRKASGKRGRLVMAGNIGEFRAFAEVARSDGQCLERAQRSAHGDPREDAREKHQYQRERGCHARVGLQRRLKRVEAATHLNGNVVTDKCRHTPRAHSADAVALEQSLGVERLGRVEHAALPDKPPPHINLGRAYAAAPHQVTLHHRRNLVLRNRQGSFRDHLAQQLVVLVKVGEAKLHERPVGDAQPQHQTEER